MLSQDILREIISRINWPNVISDFDREGEEDIVWIFGLKHPVCITMEDHNLTVISLDYDNLGDSEMLHIDLQEADFDEVIKVDEIEIWYENTGGGWQGGLIDDIFIGTVSSWAEAKKLANVDVEETDRNRDRYYWRASGKLG